VTAESEGLLSWLAFRLQESNAIAGLPESQQQELRQTIRRWNLAHLDCEVELEGLLASARRFDIRFMAFKGHSVARTLYPHPACRTTSDFDFLVDERQLELVRPWLSAAGYVPTDPFAGTIWLGAQNWVRESDGVVRFHADIHWDYTSRMYFRRRLAFEEIWAESVELPCGDASLRVPCPADNLVFACVHLAAFDPGVKVRLIWLLDIYLLMRGMEEAAVPFFLERAQKAHAVEACLVFGEMAAELGDGVEVEHVLEGVRGVAQRRRWDFYQWTLGNRGVDLLAYWGRLSLSDKVRFFGDMVRWLRVRNRG
jgi:hypothetical protein